MNLAVGTVRKYAYAESFPVPEVRSLRSSILVLTSPTWRHGSRKAARTG